MKTLSVRQPWASLLCAGVKDVENRTWAPPKELIGKKILIHAGSTKVSKDFFDITPLEWCSEIANATRYGWIPSNDKVPLGKIIGFATLDGYSDSTDSLWDGGEGQVKWIFRDPYLFDEPIPAKGMLGLFDYPLDEENLPSHHKAISFLPHIEGTELVLPIGDDFLEELEDVEGPILDVTMGNVNTFFDLDASEDEYIPWDIWTIRLVSPTKTETYPIAGIETFPQTWEDTGAPIFYKSQRGEDFVKLLVCFMLERA